MKSIEICNPLLSSQDTLGESPVWDHRRQALFWVDIENGLIHAYQPSSQKTETWSMGEKIGCLVMNSYGGFILATESGLRSWDPENNCKKVFLPVRHATPENLFNDGKVDPHGRFWIGTKGPKGTSNLWMLDANNLQVKISDLWISNGLDWSADGCFFFHTDSGDHTIYRYDIDLPTAKISNRTPFFTPEKGTPDGLTIDTEGNVWTAIWDGWKVLQLSPAGEILAEIKMPIQRPTSATFGGKDMKTLFITSAWEGLTNAERQVQPYAGDVFAVQLEVPGRMMNIVTM